MSPIDSEWFYQKLDQGDKSLRDLARFMSLDPSAVSRMLKGERKMSADEQDDIAAFLGINLEEVAAHRRGKVFGFEETKQGSYDATGSLDTPPVKMFTKDDIVYKDGKRWMEKEDGTLIELHPAYGCMAGTITVMPGVDLTAPMDWEEEWGEKLYNE
ncbi:Plasmid maintenance system antidote protein [Neorhizobium galegae bv. officinalis bv. officinalis str. HAMBI 1141]|uniref:Plasmid maintenance system antidote protein n=1 Tax=Neorhizobium galegae bv. officinalis bv. officinalis str. HAMBI 1141 TaxID=1028801 RepID=A0A068T8X7_NEOGA|nr:helix-turn-helix transcriptional regulator [Neorhizobium galegae]CDN54476.1 Plasmid maintenance system antidote protein [Neorhizobium galegae bv. officinalis bv. officinalis str. HAMBI 1141]